jgi:plastocyanin
MTKAHSAALLLAAVTLVACGGGGGASSNSSATGPYGNQGTTAATVPANTIEATDGLAFNPNSLTVSKGTTVTFTFGSVTHSVAFNAGSGVADIPDSYSTSVDRTFNTTGTFAFHCNIHSYMTGQITVQ